MKSIPSQMDKSPTSFPFLFFFNWFKQIFSKHLLYAHSAQCNRKRNQSIIVSRVHGLNSKYWKVQKCLINGPSTSSNLEFSQKNEVCVRKVKIQTNSKWFKYQTGGKTNSDFRVKEEKKGFKKDKHDLSWPGKDQPIVFSARTLLAFWAE